MSIQYASKNYPCLVHKLLGLAATPIVQPGILIPDAGIYVHSFPTIKIAQDAVSFWAWEQTVSKVKMAVAAMVTALGYWTALTGRGRVISTAILASHGALGLTAFVITFSLGTLLSLGVCVVSFFEYSLSQQELPVWEGHLASIQRKGDFGNQVTAARNRICLNGGSDLAASSDKLVAKSILSDQEAFRLWGEIIPIEHEPLPKLQSVLDHLNTLKDNL